MLQTGEPAVTVGPVSPPVPGHHPGDGAVPPVRGGHHSVTPRGSHQHQAARQVPVAHVGLTVAGQLGADLRHSQPALSPEPVASPPGHEDLLQTSVAVVDVGHHTARRQPRLSRLKIFQKLVSDQFSVRGLTYQLVIFVHKFGFSSIAVTFRRKIFIFCIETVFFSRVSAEISS